jgi:putative component of toxin-antitoxin plasmid stabilization module
MEKGGEVGKPLAGLSFFREKKFDGKRLYYLVYSDVYVVLALAISDKKAQQATINQILLHLAEYQQYVFETLRNRDAI